MKKLFTILLISASTGAFAQIEQGTKALTGNLNYTYLKSESGGFSADANSFTINLQGGSFIQENLVLGLGLGYGTAGETDLFSIAPFLRKYKFINESFGWFWQTGIQYSTGSSGGSDLSGFGAAFSPGVIFFPSKKLGVELSLVGLTYNNQKTSNGGIDSTNQTLALNLNPLNLNVGASFYFGR